MFSFPEQEQQHELACDVVLDGLGRGVADGAVQRQSLAVLRDGGHLCDLNGQFIRAVDGLGADDSADHAAYAGGAGKEAEAEGVEEEEEESLGRTSGGGGGSSSSSSFASQLKAAAKAAAELAGVHNPAQGGLGEWRRITFVPSLSWQIIVFQTSLSWQIIVFQTNCSQGDSFETRVVYGCFSRQWRRRTSPSRLCACR